MAHSVLPVDLSPTRFDILPRGQPPPSTQSNVTHPVGINSILPARGILTSSVCRSVLSDLRLRLIAMMKTSCSDSAGGTKEPNSAARYTLTEHRICYKVRTYFLRRFFN